MLLITIVLTLWTIAFTAGLYVLALAMVAWFDREMMFKDELTPIEPQTLIKRK